MLYNLYQRPALMIGLIVILGIWSLIWQGIALWYAARHKQQAWFVVLLIVNTLGILPIIYLLVARPKKEVVEDSVVVVEEEAEKPVKPVKVKRKR